MSAFFFKPSIRFLICLLISLAGLLARFRLYWNKPFWNDESYQLEMTKYGLLFFWEWNFYGDFTVFPGDYLLTFPFLCLFPENVWGLRIPHVAATFALFIAFYYLCKRHLRTTAGFVVAFLILSFNATLINHSFEFRPYAVLPALAVGTLLVIERFADPRPLTIRQKFWSVVLLLFVSIFHAYGFFMIFFSWALQLASVERDQIMDFINRHRRILLNTMVICFLLWLWYSIGSKVKFNISPDRFSGTDIHPFRYIPHPLLDPLGFAKGVVGNLTGNKYLYLFLIGLVGIFFGGSQRVSYQLRYLTYLILIPLMLMLTLTLMGGYYFLQRQFIWLMPLWALFLAQQWDWFFQKLVFRKNTA